MFDPTHPDFIRDPYPHYERLRTLDPVHRSDQGYWVLTRYDDVMLALNDRRLSNEPSRYAVTHRRNAHRYVAAAVANNIIPFMDAPRHGSQRKLISQAFAAQLRTHPPPIEDIARDLLARHAGAGRMDVVHDYARPLAVRVIAHLLGLDPSMDAQIQRWSAWFFHLFVSIPSREVLEQLNQALSDFRAFLDQAVARRRDSGDDDLISRLMHTEDEGERLSHQAVVDTCMLLLADGIANVDSAIATAVLLALDDAPLRDRLRAEPSLAAGVVSEALRLHAPGQFIAKWAREDFDLAGKTIRANDVLLLVLGAANRDPEAFHDPDAVRPNRSGNAHLALGRGHHACVGAALVRREAETALLCLVNACPNATLASPPQWETRPGHRWLQTLTVHWTPEHTILPGA